MSLLSYFNIVAGRQPDPPDVEEDLDVLSAAAQAQLATELGLVWPPAEGRMRPGRPSFDELYEGPLLVKILEDPLSGAPKSLF